MSIWFKPMTLQEVAQSRAGTMVDHLGITFTLIGDDFLTAIMPVDNRTRQPMGIMHGGASCALAETVASIAANYCIDPKQKVCVGLEINTSHVKMVRDGFVTATARPLHLGKSTQLWDVPITDDEGRLVSTTRIRMAVLDRPAEGK